MRAQDHLAARDQLSTSAQFDEVALLERVAMGFGPKEAEHDSDFAPRAR